MTAPAATARSTPAGIMLENGFSSLITFAADPDISLWEIDVGVTGISGGDAINIKTMWNDVWAPKAPQALKEQTEAQTKFAYDPALKSQIAALINVRTTITKLYPDGSTEAYYGYLREVEFDQLKDGEFPTGTLTEQPTNWDPTAHAEAGPTIVSVAGT